MICFKSYANHIIETGNRCLRTAVAHTRAVHEHFALFLVMFLFIVLLVVCTQFHEILMSISFQSTRDFRRVLAYVLTQSLTAYYCAWGIS